MIIASSAWARVGVRGAQHMLSVVVASLGIVAIAGLGVASAAVGARTSNGAERRVFRKWCGIWSAGVFLFLVVPGALAYLAVIPEIAAGVLPAAYVVLFAPTLGWFVNEMGAARSKGNSPSAEPNAAPDRGVIR
jgi:hypothetical protein